MSDTATREPQWDILRGLLLLWMLAEHFGSPQGQAWFGNLNAADGFVLLSGFLAVRPALASSGVRSGWAATLRRRLGRLREIWFWHLGTIAALLAAVAAVPAVAAFWLERAPQAAEPLSALLLGGVLLFQPYQMDVLPLFLWGGVGLALVAPLWRSRWLPGLLALSASLWVAAQMKLGWTLKKWVAAHSGGEMGAFDPLGWQAAFVLGGVLALAAAQGRLGWMQRRSAVLAALAIVVAGICAAHLPEISQHRWMAALSSKRSLGPLRLLEALAWTVLLCQGWRWARRWPEWWPLAALGRRSLAVFGLQSLLLIAYYPALEATGWGRWAQVFAAVCVIAAFLLGAAIAQRRAFAAAGKGGDPVAAEPPTR